jgi:hypothetical protein
MSMLTRYLLIAGSITAAFANFIACGAQFYKVSLKEDHEQKQGTQLANSFDPDSPEFGLHAPKGWRNLPIRYKTDTNMPALQFSALKSAIQTWELAVGRTLFSFDGKHTGKTGDSFPDLYSSLRDGLNGQYNDGIWSKTGKSRMVLATTIWNNPGNAYETIDAADIRYNSEVYFISDALTEKPMDDRELVDMQSLATHELGHLLGLAHVDEKYDSSSIMNPSIFIGEGMAMRSLSVGDIQRIQKIYGCQGSSCNAEATARSIMQSRSSYGLSGATPEKNEEESSEAGH